jgi:hypothetical protein
MTEKMEKRLLFMEGLTEKERRVREMVKRAQIHEKKHIMV